MEFRDKKGKKKKAPGGFEQEKITNYDLLKKLGFDKESIQEERNEHKNKQKLANY